MTMETDYGAEARALARFLVSERGLLASEACITCALGVGTLLRMAGDSEDKKVEALVAAFEQARMAAGLPRPAAKDKKRAGH